ncbi:MAG TPA: DnaJ domain-containing protein [Ktedonobacterales bacterium]
MADETDYYTTLDVPRDVDADTLRLAYRRLAWRYHPDVAGPDGLDRMREINAAYQALSDPARRKDYDASLQETRPHVERARPRPQAERVGTQVSREGPFMRLLRVNWLDTSPVVAAASAAGGGLWALGQLDGQVAVLSSRDGGVVRKLTFGDSAAAGALQALRLSPQGRIAVAWGFGLGTRVWSVGDGRTLWNAGMNAPTGAMDAVAYDSPEYVRIAAPDAPIALSSDDPFRWAEDGRKATAVYTRPLGGQIGAAWVNPLRCVETGHLGMLREPPDENWRTHGRALSLDGRSLLTFSTGRVATLGRANTLRIWDLERRNLRGAQEPRAVGQVSETAGMIQNPIAVTPDLQWVAASLLGRQVRLFDLRNRRQRNVEIGRIQPDTRLALSADGAWLAVATGTRLQVFDTERGGQRQEWKAGSDVTALAFAATGGAATLAFGLRSGLAELWRA